MSWRKYIPRGKADQQAEGSGNKPDREIGVSRREFITGATGLAAGAAVFGSTGCLPGDSADAALPGSDRILIRGGCVITADPYIGDFEEADVLVENSSIAEVRPEIDIEDDVDIVDASGMIVMPGFVDTHRHMWQGALRNILPDGLLEDYVESILGARPGYRPEDVYIGNLASALGAINAGVTTVLDWSHIGNSPEHTDAAVEALRDSGLRAVYAFGGGAAGADNQFPDDIHRLRSEHFTSDNQLLTLALAAGINESQWEIAREADVRISVHVNGTGDLLPLAEALGPDVTCIHCPNLLEEEWELLADTGTRVSIAGPIEMMMGHGVPPIQKVLDHGIRPSLSIDVETQIPGDMFTQMQSIFTLQRMQILERRRAGEDGLPELLTVKDLVEFATIQGAIDNGLGRITGSLTPGKQADIILLRRDRINVMPVNNAYGAVVLGMDTGNVDTVFINGKVKKWRGELTDADPDRINHQLQESRNHIISEAGWPETYFGGYAPGH